MKKRLIAGLLSAAVLSGVSVIHAEAACKGATHCYGATTKTTLTSKSTAAHRRLAPPKTASTQPRKRVQAASKANAGTRRISAIRRGNTDAAAIVIPASATAAQGNVIALIKAMAPGQGVPTWFALRIAHVESNYNPHMRGAHGEYGVFQMKCSTARDIGFSGACAALLDPRTNIHWGLRHLAIAIGKADGNLRLAASKHNAGLSRRTIVASYVAKVF
ncbi:lytic transglycosylase domain-containing protein [Aestuariivirga sp.]|uniref:lytic transglycosylase domain-containing protein n=1 Tax=Aestuariivirga sp. TaxID=2650926 RepID=UPI0025B969D8|nr:lytic transglycosylase domain-containing protein [Aestuariivirga sp.]MCA3554751.1 lytic transglycosylase domain-containing protein [Aestuariivirga sp.]